MLQRLFKPRAAAESGRRLYAAAAVQARDPALYTDYGVPDTGEGRFELYSLHVVLLLHRLKRQGDQAAETGQALFDAYVQALDDALREMGVGDLSVGKKMRKLGEAFYGRAKAYDAALANLPDRAELEALIGRTVYAGTDATQAGRLTDYAIRTADELAALPLDALLAGEVAWASA